MPLRKYDLETYAINTPDLKLPKGTICIWSDESPDSGGVVDTDFVYVTDFTYHEICAIEAFLRGRTRQYAGHFIGVVFEHFWMQPHINSPVLLADWLTSYKVLLLAAQSDTPDLPKSVIQKCLPRWVEAERERLAVWEDRLEVVDSKKADPTTATRWKKACEASKQHIAAIAQLLAESEEK